MTGALTDKFGGKDTEHVLQMFKDMVIVENVFRIVNEMDDDELDRRLGELERALGLATTLDPAAGEGPTRLH